MGWRIAQAEKLNMEGPLPYLAALAALAAPAAAAATTRTVSPSDRKPTPCVTTGSPAFSPARISTRSPARLHLGLAHLAALDAEDVGEAVAQQQRRLRQRQHGRFAQHELAAREHAGAGAGMRRQVDQHAAHAVGRVDRRRHQAHAAVQRQAAGGRDAHLLPDPDAPKVGARHFGAPLQAAVADQREQALPGLRQAALDGLLGGDDAVRRRDDAGEGQAQLVRLHARLQRRDPRARRRLGRLGLLDLLGADGVRAGQALQPRGGGRGVLRRGLGFEQAGTRGGQLGAQACRCELGQQLALLHPLADIHQHALDALAGGLGAHLHLAPGGQAAVGGQRLRPGLAARLHGGHAQRRLGRAGGLGLRVGGAGRLQGQQQGAGQGQQQRGAGEGRKGGLLELHGRRFQLFLDPVQPPPRARTSCR
jgi:hypothetical protein